MSQESFEEWGENVAPRSWVSNLSDSASASSNFSTFVFLSYSLSENGVFKRSNVFALFGLPTDGENGHIFENSGTFLGFTLRVFGESSLSNDFSFNSSILLGSIPTNDAFMSGV